MERIPYDSNLIPEHTRLETAIALVFMMIASYVIGCLIGAVICDIFIK